jgi:AcrR family transcriptional regulator
MALKSPPAQNTRGVIIYHENPELDDRIREVKRLRGRGYDLDAIQAEIGVSRRSLFYYFAQVALATQAYMTAFPSEFGSDVEALKLAILERRQLDRTLRRELAGLGKDPKPFNKVAIYKLVLQNLRELEDLAGLRVRRIEHAGEIAVKDSLAAVLEKVPADIRQEYIAALEAVIAAAEEISSTK